MLLIKFQKTNNVISRSYKEDKKGNDNQTAKAETLNPSSISN